ncbi:SLBB domain-containing protein [Egbenema bharatensis]|uniref:SLBB domain-containing protein n=1 Tax=Egbenema bharatensis TaxID=3463334 RepID=UPI003A87722C
MMNTPKLKGSIQSTASLAILMVGLMAGVPPVGLAQTSAEPGTSEVSPDSLPTAINADTPTPSLQMVEAYTLGAGDRIYLDFFNVPEYTGETQILTDGTLNLPLIGSLAVQGMSLRETSDAITAAYGQLLRNPIVTVRLVSPRPLRVSIAGEVNRPGSYAMSLGAEAGGTGEPQWPTVTQVIQTAGGITQQADISNIRIQRAQRSGVPQEITVNLWELLQQADLSQDLPLRDGDTILIATATSLQPAEATQLSTASFSPNTIQVGVVGEVVTPGMVEVPPNTPLNQALMAAGGFDHRRARTSRVDLIRLNPDGSATQRTVEIDFSQGINEASNPALRNNDVIVVGRSGSASFSDTIDSIFGTIGRFIPFFGLF